MYLFLQKFFKKNNIHREDIVTFLLEKGNNLLDIGCGSGSLILKAKGKFDKLYGIDIDSDKIKEAKKIAKKNFPSNNSLHFFVFDVNKGINFGDNFFDTVTMIAALAYIYDPFFIIKEINRVLKKNGIFIVQVSNIAYIKHRIRLLFGQLPITTSPYNYKNWQNLGWDRGVLHYFTLNSLKWLLKLNGFKIEVVSGSGLFAGLRNWWPSFLCGDICIKARKL